MGEGKGRGKEVTMKTDVCVIGIISKHLSPKKAGLQDQKIEVVQ